MSNNNLLKMEKTILSIPKQVEKAMDGRPQRWLALRIMMPEDELSKRMNGKKEFTDEELKKISELLDVKFKK